MTCSKEWGNVRTPIIEESRNLRTNLTVTEEDYSGLLHGPEVPLDMEQEITDEETIDLLEDEK